MAVATSHEAAGSADVSAGSSAGWPRKTWLIMCDERHSPAASVR